MNGRILLFVALVWSVQLADLHAGSPSILEIEMEALRAFKNSITEDPHGELVDWTETNRLCNWSGIACDPLTNLVVSVSLAGKGLQGIISPFIGNLSSLQVLDLTSNFFTGIIPSSISNCTSLIELSLSLNRLTGMIPLHIGDLASLQLLAAFGNDLVGPVPISISKLGALRALDLSRNRLSGAIPRQVGNLSNLEYLKLSENMLVGNIPLELSYCSKLVSLILLGNLITGEIPSNVGLLHNLVNITVYNNFLGGSIPPSISNCSHLFDLGLAYNRIGGKVPEDIGKLQNLKFVRLQGNKLSGEIPDGLYNCSNLKLVDLSMNGFEGMIKPLVGKLATNLCSFQARENSLIGRIPEEMGNLSKLICLGFSGNKLSGIVPQELFNLSLLQGLFLGDNLFEGRIPDRVFDFTCLNRLELQRNKFVGPIPDSPSQLQSLSILNLSGNMLNGSIPISLAQLTAFMSLDLSHNRLTGSIPKPFVASLKSIQIYLNLSGNLLSGPIPEEVGMLEMAQVIDISKNKLSGSIPKSFAGCRNMISLDLSGNELAAQIPNEIFTTMGALVRLNLSKNQFSGGIPESLGHLNNLTAIDLSQNSFRGKIPESLGNLSSLSILNLSFNQLEGPIPKAGIFRNIDPSSLAGNHALCGAQFLNPCTRNSPLEFFSKKPIKVLVVVGLMFIIAVILLVFSPLKHYIFMQRRKETDNPHLAYNPTVALKRFERKDLETATRSFSEENIIGATTLSIVYKGRLEDGRIAAIKKFNSSHFSKESDKCFNREVQILSQLKHRSLVKVLGYAWDNRKLRALILEYMENGNLDNIIHEPNVDCSRWTLPERIDVLVSIASALEYLHSGYDFPIVHCDLKPSNILLDGDWQAHVSDFGTSRILGVHRDNGSSASSTVAFEGTIGYLPPEFAYMRKVTTKVDVFSFGIVVMEVLTKRRPAGLTQEDGSPITLRDLVERTLVRGKEQLLQYIDPSLVVSNNFESNVKKIEELLRLTLYCTSTEPENRPDMDGVLSSLLKIKAT